MYNKSILSICIGLLTLLSLGFIQMNREQPLPTFDVFPIYPFTDLNGQAYHFDNSRIKLITFFYTKCPDVCPITIHDLTKLHKELSKQDLLENNVDILTITLDPDHDTEQLLKEYKKSFQIQDDKHWYFLRGTEETMTQLTDELGFYREESGGYWSHSTTIYLVDYENRKRSFHLMSDANEPLDTEKIIKEIRLLKKEARR